jgi:hypothetical protein
MSVTNGQPADQNTFNAAFLSRTSNTSTTGVVALNNVSDPNSGATISNVQRGINEIFDTVGITGIGDATAKTYSSTTTIANGDSRKVAIGKLDAQVGANTTALADVVTLTTTQTVSGAKTFSAKVTIQNNLGIEGVQQTLLNNQSSNVSLTDLSFDKDNFQTIIGFFTLYRRDDGEGRRAVGKFVAHYEREGAAWSVDFTQEAGDIDFGGTTLDFTDTAGVLQIVYQSDNMAGGNYSGVFTSGTVYQFPTEA